MQISPSPIRDSRMFISSYLECRPACRQHISSTFDLHVFHLRAPGFIPSLNSILAPAGKCRSQQRGPPRGSPAFSPAMELREGPAKRCEPRQLTAAFPRLQRR